MSTALYNLSIIVPIAPGDFAWRKLLSDFLLLPINTEIIFVATQKLQESEKKILKPLQHNFSVKWLVAEQGRAKQINAAMKVAARDFFWILHCDSRFDANNLNAIANAQLARSIYFFRLRFHENFPLMRINEWGVRFRSEVLAMPFGDQGFLMHRDILAEVGLFRTDLRYGEDHEYIWRARRKNYQLQPFSSSLATSARKYQANGWLRTSLKHLFLTFLQAGPEFFRYILEKSPMKKGEDIA